MDISKYELKKLPRPPKKICRTFVDYLFGIASPGLVMGYSFSRDKEISKYFTNVKRYKLYKRTLKKEEYKSLVRELKRGDHILCVQDMKM